MKRKVVDNYLNHNVDNDDVDSHLYYVQLVAVVVVDKIVFDFVVVVVVAVVAAEIDLVNHVVHWVLDLHYRN